MSAPTSTDLARGMHERLRQDGFRSIPWSDWVLKDLDARLARQVALEIAAWLRGQGCEYEAAALEAAE